MIANTTYPYLFNFDARKYSKSYSRASLLYPSLSHNTSNILPSLNQLPIPNLNHNKLPPIQFRKTQVKTPSQQQLRFKCQKCTKSFNRKNSLVRHERVHTGNKPYSCKICNKSFTRKDILEGHKLSVKCQRRTQFHLSNNSSTITKTTNLMEEPSDVSSLSSSTSSPVIDNSRKNSIASLLSSNNTDYYFQDFTIEEQWSPLRLPSLSGIYEF